MEDSRQSETEGKKSEFVVIAVIYLLHSPCVTFSSYLYIWLANVWGGILKTITLAPPPPPLRDIIADISKRPMETLDSAAQILALMDVESPISGEVWVLSAGA